MHSERATALGASAVLLWSLLAALTVGVKRLPTLQVLALTFAGAAALGFVLARARGTSPWLTARRWPGVRATHLLGAMLGLAGAWLVISGGGSLTLRPAHTLGYAAAGGCALIWSAYSVANRRYAQAPTDVVTLACLFTATLGGLAHLIFEQTLAPTAAEWILVLILGVGPVGAAFFLWDYGTKQGHLPLLGVLSYAAPVLSTIVLVLCGEAVASWTLAAAALLVAGGAALASMQRPR